MSGSVWKMSLASISENINFKFFLATSFIAIFKDDISLGGYILKPIYQYRWWYPEINIDDDILKPIYQSSIGDDT